MIWEDDGLEPLERPEHVEALLDRADDDRKARQLRGEANPLVEQWKREEIASAEIWGRCETRTANARCIRALGHPDGCFLTVGAGL